MDYLTAVQLKLDGNGGKGTGERLRFKAESTRAKQRRKREENYKSTIILALKKIYSAETGNGYASHVGGFDWLIWFETD